MLRVEHAVKTEAVALVPACRAPIRIGINLVLREPGNAAGIVIVMAPRIPSEAGEVFIEASSVVDIESAPILFTLCLNLSELTDSRIRARDVARCQRSIHVHGTEEPDATVHAPPDRDSAFLAHFAVNLIRLVRLRDATTCQEKAPIQAVTPCTEERGENEYLAGYRQYLSCMRPMGTTHFP